MFGEVFDANPELMSRYTTEGDLQATLDFGFQAAARGFAEGKPTTGVRDLFAGDDYYTDTDSNAYQLPTFLGNHDMGRIGSMLDDTASGDDLLARTRLANQLMYLVRGQPVVYYGDEQGFIGDGGDKDARQDMFASQVTSYNDDAMIGGVPTGSRDRFGTDGPLYQAISELGALRDKYPALADGAQVHRYASDSAGVYAFSRVSRDKKPVEYLVVANNSTEPKTADLATWSRDDRWKPLYGGGSRLRTDAEGRVTVTVPPLSVQVWRATDSVDAAKKVPAVHLTSPSDGSVVGGRAEIAAVVPENTYAQVSFAYRPVGTTDWTNLGTDDNAPFRVFHDVSDVADGTLLEYRTVLEDARGRLSASSGYGVVGEPVGGGDGGGGGGVEPVEQPAGVAVAGDHNSEMGCPGDWQPDCAQAQLALDDDDEIWKGEFDLPAGSFAYKAALNGNWNENYGAGGAPNGGNISYTAPGTPVSFYYEHSRHYVTSDAEHAIMTLAGSLQSELGCSADWAPDCMRGWLIDPDGDGVATYATSRLPAGGYEVKVAEGLSWDVNYGAGGAPGGANIPFTVAAGTVVRFAYDMDTHVLTVTLGGAGRDPRPRGGQGPLGGQGPARLARRRAAARHHAGAAALAPAPRARRRSGHRRRGRHRRPQRAADLRPGGPAGRGAAAVPAPGGLPGAAARQGHGAHGGRPAHRAAGRRPVRQPRTPARRHRRAGAGGARRPLPEGGQAPARPHLGRPRAVAGAVGADGQGRRRPGLEGGEHGAATGPGAARRRRRVDRARHVVVARCAVPVRGDGVGAVDAGGGDQPGHRPVLGRAHDELDPLGGRRPRRPGAGAAAVAHHAVAEAGAGGRLLDLRAARARLLDRRRERPGRAPRHLPGLRRRGRRPPAPARAGRRRPEHRAPAADVRHHLDRGGARRPGGAGVRPGVVRPGLDRAAGLRHGRGRRRRLQLGLRPVPLDGAGGLVRDGARGRGARGGVPHHGGCAARRRPAGRGGRGLQPHLGLGPGGHLGARQGRAGVLPPAEPDHGCGGDQHLLPEHRHRAHHGGQGDGRRGGAVGQAVQGRRLPVRPDGPPLEAEHGRRPRGARQADPEEGRRRRQGDLPLRRGLELRRGGDRTRGSSRPPRASSAARASGPSPTGCATPSAAVARSTRTRGSRASAPACSATRTATPAPTRTTSWRRGRPTPPT